MKLNAAASNCLDQPGISTMLRSSGLAPLVLLAGLAAPAFSQTAEKPAVTEPPVVTAFAAAETAPCDGLPGCDFVLLAGDPATGPSQWFFRLGGGTEFPRHWHSTPENMVMIEGALTFHFETGETHTLVPGELLRYQEGMVHWGQCEPGADCLYYVFNDEPYDFHAAE